MSRTYRNEPNYESTISNNNNYYQDTTMRYAYNKNNNFNGSNSKDLITSLQKDFRKSNRQFDNNDLLRSNSINPSTMYKVDKSPSPEQLNFIKMIFSMLTKTAQGDAPKRTIPNDMKLDDEMINDLGFTDKIDFNRKLMVYPTKIPNYMNEEEFTLFLLDKGVFKKDPDMGEFYTVDLKKSNKESHKYKTDAEIKYKKKEKEIFNIKNIRNQMNNSIDEMLYETPNYNNNNVYTSNNEELPGLATNTMNFLEERTTKRRLRKLNKSLNKSYHGSLSRSKITYKQHALNTSVNHRKFPTPSKMNNMRQSLSKEKYKNNNKVSNQLSRSMNLKNTFNTTLKQTYATNKSKVQYEDTVNYNYQTGALNMMEDDDDNKLNNSCHLIGLGYDDDYVNNNDIDYEIENYERKLMPRRNSEEI